MVIAASGLPKEKSVKESSPQTCPTTKATWRALSVPRASEADRRKLPTMDSNLEQLMQAQTRLQGTGPRAQTNSPKLNNGQVPSILSLALLKRLKHDQIELQDSSLPSCLCSLSTGLPMVSGLIVDCLLIYRESAKPPYLLTLFAKGSIVDLLGTVGGILVHIQPASQ